MIEAVSLGYAGLSAEPDRLRSFVAGQWPRCLVSTIQTFPGELCAYDESPLTGSVIKDLGFTRPKFQRRSHEFGYLRFSEVLSFSPRSMPGLDYAAISACVIIRHGRCAAVRSAT